MKIKIIDKVFDNFLDKRYFMCKMLNSLETQ